jgi:putative salt-induced outer membrane protein
MTLVIGVPFVLASPAQASPLPEAIRAMIGTAAKSDDPAVFAAVVAVARQTAPDSGEEIDAIVAEAKTQAQAQAQAQAQGQAPAQPQAEAQRQAAAPPVRQVARAAPHVEASQGLRWKGSVELGGSRSTGTSDVLGLYGAFDVSGAAGPWTHKLSARADYQKTDEQISTDRYGLAYQPQIRIYPSVYLYGIAQYEHDRLLGYENRETLGMGAGLTAADRPALKISLEAGPALRRTQYYADYYPGPSQEEALAGRASINLKWLPSSNVTLAQEGAFYLEGDRKTARSSTALETLLFGPLKARLSYNVQYEQDQRTSRSDLDTTTRASLLYSF